MPLDLPTDIVEEGRKQFQWARRNMPALSLAKNYVTRKGAKEILSGIRLGVCLHISKETAVLIDAFRSFAMEIDLVAANPLSTKDSIAAYLSSIGIKVRGRGFGSEAEYLSAIESLAKSSPQMIIDDGGELHVAYSRVNSRSCLGGTDETTSGTTRLRSLEKEGKLRYPVIPVNEAKTKHFFDNKYGTGQSSLDGLVRATGLLLAGKLVVVSGYGWVGKGVAERARGMGARVIVTEVDPIAALEAHLDGYEVERMNDIVAKAEIFLTCTGQIDVISKNDFKRMRDGAILGNCGHFDKEIDANDLRATSQGQREVNRNMTEYKLSGKSIFLLCEGRVVNLVAGEGHPPEVMQLSFANQLLSIHYLASHKERLKEEHPRILPFPREIDEQVARFALSAFDLRIDQLNAKQKRYASSFIR
jgi:adenosylhomocysteinase